MPVTRLHKGIHKVGGWLQYSLDMGAFQQVKNDTEAGQAGVHADGNHLTSSGLADGQVSGSDGDLSPSALANRARQRSYRKRARSPSRSVTIGVTLMTLSVPLLPPTCPRAAPSPTCLRSCFICRVQCINVTSALVCVPVEPAC